VRTDYSVARMAGISSISSCWPVTIDCDVADEIVAET
jgi:hypothetical protein